MATGRADDSVDDDVIEPDDDLEANELDEDDDFDQADETEDADELEDADDDEIDFCVALYREDGEPSGLALEPDLANDFEELLAQLQRIPGDAGALGLVSLDSEVLVAVRVRGPRHVQVFVSDVYYVDIWPIVHDAVEFLGLDPTSDELPEDGPIGDLNMFADLGLSEMDIEAACLDDEETTSEDLAARIAKAARLDAVFRQAVDDYWDVEDEE